MPKSAAFSQKTLYVLLAKRGLMLSAIGEDTMHWLWVILIGLIIGAVAKLIMPGKDPSGFIITILLGIAGSLVGTWIGRAVGLYQEGQSAGFIMSVIGAIILLAIYHFFTRRRAAV
ncbi:MAG TPA: GlsB/YeaQ/YmgE family stress response membrane protein [Terriglobales bacterium]|nr:GlsB/YeaQ/YmgE family stress response membrane protein [Terriglobales bacterium]